MQHMETLPGIPKTFLTHRHKFPPVMCWIGMSMAVLAFDYASFPIVRFPIVYILPVGFAAWYSGRQWGLLLAIVLPLVRLYFTTLWAAPWTFSDSIINAVIRITVLVGFVILVDRVARRTKELSREVEVLEDLLPICGFCKKILVAEGECHHFGDYIGKNSKVRLNQRYCLECAEQYLSTRESEGRVGR